MCATPYPTTPYPTPYPEMCATPYPEGTRHDVGLDQFTGGDRDVVDLDFLLDGFQHLFGAGFGAQPEQEALGLLEQVEARVIYTLEVVPTQYPSHRSTLHETLRVRWCDNTAHGDVGLGRGVRCGVGLDQGHRAAAILSPVRNCQKA